MYDHVNYCSMNIYQHSSFMAHFTHHKELVFVSNNLQLSYISTLLCYAWVT